MISLQDFKFDFTIIVRAGSDFFDYDITDDEIVYLSGLIPRTVKINNFYKIEVNKKN